MFYYYFICQALQGKKFLHNLALQEQMFMTNYTILRLFLIDRTSTRENCTSLWWQVFSRICCRAVSFEQFTTLQSCYIHFYLNKLKTANPLILNLGEMERYQEKGRSRGSGRRRMTKHTLLGGGWVTRPKLPSYHQ